MARTTDNSGCTERRGCISCNSEECRWEEGIWCEGDHRMIRGDRNNSAWPCLHCLLAACWPLRRKGCLPVNTISLK